MATLTQQDVDQSASARFWRYWAAAAISSTGSAVTAVALPLVAVVTLDATAFEASLVTAASYAAWLLIGLPAGVLVARSPLRGMQIAMDLVRAVALASLPVAWWLDGLTLVHLVAVALVVSLASVVFDVGNATFMTAVVPREQLTSRNSLMSGTQAVTSVGGPSLGGLFVQLLGAVPTLLLDCVSYLVSALLLSALPKGESPPAAGSRVRMREQIAQGCSFIARHPVMRPAVIAATAVNFVAGGLLAITPVYLVRTLEVSPGLVGLVVATEGLGALLGASLTGRLVRSRGSARAVLLASAVGGLLALLLPFGEGGVGLVAFVLGNTGFSAGVVVLSICTRTHRQQATPPELLSRVMATVRFISWGAVPVGALAAGVVASATAPRIAVALLGVLALAPPALLWSSTLRHLRELDEGEPSEDRSSSVG